MPLKLVVEPEPEKIGLDLIKKVIDPDISSFEEHFKKVSNSNLIQMEKEILRAYIYYKILVQKDEK